MAQKLFPAVDGILVNTVLEGRMHRKHALGLAQDEIAPRGHALIELYDYPLCDFGLAYKLVIPTA